MIKLIEVADRAGSALWSTVGLTREDIVFASDTIDEFVPGLTVPSYSTRDTDHPLAEAMFGMDSKDLKELHSLAVELKKVADIPNFSVVLDRLRSNKFDDFMGARGEIKAGAWGRNGLRSLRYVLPKSKSGKSPDSIW